MARGGENRRKRWKWEVKFESRPAFVSTVLAAASLLTWTSQYNLFPFLNTPLCLPAMIWHAIHLKSRKSALVYHSLVCSINADLPTAIEWRKAEQQDSRLHMS